MSAYHLPWSEIFPYTAIEFFFYCNHSLRSKISKHTIQTEVYHSLCGELDPYTIQTEVYHSLCGELNPYTIQTEVYHSLWGEFNPYTIQTEVYHSLWGEFNPCTIQTEVCLSLTLWWIQPVPNTNWSLSEFSLFTIPLLQRNEVSWA